MRAFTIALLLVAAAAQSTYTILTSSASAPAERLAAAELRRYLFDTRASLDLAAIATASSPSDVSSSASHGAVIVLATSSTAPALLGADVLAPSDGADGYVISVRADGVTAIVGSDAQHALFGAYSYLEARGCAFTSAGPTLPSVLAPLPVGWSSRDSPVFTTRGLQPFHDFAEGPDWWSEDETKRMIEAIVSMKGNLIGFHTYPLQEPAVWVGLASSVTPSGNVTDAYPTRWATTLEPSRAWGYNALNTSDMGFGATQIFEDECFGHETVSGDPALCPEPATAADSVELFNRVGLYWQKSFAHAKALGVQTVLGTEIPLAMPSPPPPAPGATVALQVWYSAARHDHFVTASACPECDNMYVFVGTAGWVATSNSSGAIALCTYAGALANGEIDNILARCDAGAPPGHGFVRIEGYAPAPGTPGTEPLMQYVNAAGHHWAATAAWAANVTAAGFTPAGVIAGVFSTGPPLPTPPDAQAYYEGIFTRLVALLGDSLNFYWGWTPEGWEWDKVDINNPLIQDAVHDTQKMQAAWEAIAPPFKLASCGWTVGPLGARWYYDTVLPPSWAITSIDMDVGNTPVDPAYANITHRTAANKWLVAGRVEAIPWAEDDPGLTAPELWVNRSLSHARDAASYGVGGLLSIHWRTRMTSPQIGSAHAVAWNLSLTTADYWNTWALGQFGDAAVAAAASAVFQNSADSYNLPRPVNWIGGPGGMSPSTSMCNYATVYAWVDTLVALRPALISAIAGGTATLAHLERFDYWAGQFVYMRSIAATECEWAAYNSVIEGVKKINDPAARQAAARAQGVPARIALIASVATTVGDLLATVSTIEGSGTTYNVLSHSLWDAVGPAATASLVALTGQPLPPAALPPPGYSPARPPQLRVQVIRTMLAVGEPLRVRAVLMTGVVQAPSAVTFFWAPAGPAPAWSSMPLAQAPPVGGVARYVFTAELPPQASDFQWYVRADLPAGGPYTEGLGIPAGTIVAADGTVTCFVPPGGADAPQSVVIVPA